MIVAIRQHRPCLDGHPVAVATLVRLQGQHYNRIFGVCVQAHTLIASLMKSAIHKTVGRPQTDSLDETRRVLNEINAAVSGYDPVLREKAMDILLAKAFGLSSPTGPSSRANGHSAVSFPWHDASRIELKTLINSWRPKTQSEWALLCAYYLQRILGYKVLTGRQIQSCLKRYGLGLTNVTVATHQNTKIEPARITRKKLKGSKQNCYMITEAGVEYVESMLNAT